jgi:hypothetical protein
VYPGDHPLNHPRMIAHIHGANTEHLSREQLATGMCWRRAPEYDEYCAKAMNL